MVRHQADIGPPVPKMVDATGYVKKSLNEKTDSGETCHRSSLRWRLCGYGRRGTDDGNTRRTGTLYLYVIVAAGISIGREFERFEACAALCFSF